MGILKITAFSAKILVTGGAVYYTHQYGIWGNTQQTEEGYARLKAQIQNNEYSKELKKLSSEYLGDIGTPFEQMKNVDIKSKIPEISWNKSVESTFDFISKSPTLLKEFATQAQGFVGEQLQGAVLAQPQTLPDLSLKKEEGKPSEIK